MYVFGEFVLDLQLYQLRRADQVVPLEPKVFDVLRYLVEHSDRVATKRELLDALWPHEVVTEAVLPTNINALRRALGQQRGEKTPIETVHGRGYRFSMPVQRASQPALVDQERLSREPRPAAPELVTGEPYVGRAALHDKLRKILLRALGEQGQICILSGESGSGKTRTSRQLVELARAHGADVWQASCEDGAVPPLWVFQQVLRAALASEGAEGFRRWLGPLASDLTELVAALSDPREARLLGATREQGSIRVFDAMVRVLSQASRTRARVLWLEDMQRADDASWQLLRMLLPHLERASVLVLITLRSRDDLTLGAPVQHHLDLLLRTPSCQRLVLRGLEVGEVGQLASQLLSVRARGELARALHDKTGGNPLFVRGLVEWLDARGRSDADALRELPSMTPGELARHVLRRRIARLGADVKLLLEAGAVTGASWDAAVVERVCGLPHKLFEDALDTALEQRVLVPLPDRSDAYRFAHELLRDTLYVDAPARERRRLHLRAAAALEPRIAWLGVDGVRDVADHLYRALPEGDPQRAIEWLERAAELYEEAADYREAARLYRAALGAALLAVPGDPAHSGAPTALRDRVPGQERAARVQS